MQRWRSENGNLPDCRPTPISQAGWAWRSHPLSRQGADVQDVASALDRHRAWHGRRTAPCAEPPPRRRPVLASLPTAALALGEWQDQEVPPTSAGFTKAAARLRTRSTGDAVSNVELPFVRDTNVGEHLQEAALPLPSDRYRSGCSPTECRQRPWQARSIVVGSTPRYRLRAGRNTADSDEDAAPVSVRPASVPAESHLTMAAPPRCWRVPVNRRASLHQLLPVPLPRHQVVQ